MTYEDELVLRQFICEVIRKSGSKWCLYSKHKKGGKRKKLGCHDSKKGAQDQERAVHAHGG